MQKTERRVHEDDDPVAIINRIVDDVHAGGTQVARGEI